ncbi:hypothetical protein BaRGS_00034802, partial [Batillaria attramentaria]
IILVCLGAIASSSGAKAQSCHAETCLPLQSGLIKTTPLLKSPEEITVKKRQEQTSSSRFGRCFDFKKLPFRTADGSCNNYFTSHGESEQPLARLLPAQYGDSSFAPRKFSTVNPANPLPSPRDVSRAVHPDITATSQLTIMMMQWGQFIDHELVSTPLPIEDTRGLQQCCGDGMTAPTEPPTNPECFPIVFSTSDPDFDGECMEFFRSQPALDEYGNMTTPRENRNSVTSFLDASTVYGSTEERLASVRDEANPHLLKTTADNFPPDNGLDDCVKRDSNDICFLAGDERANEHPALTLTHTIFMRLHNLIASEIMAIVTHNDADQVFRLARSVVEAIEQQITYGEWLPILLGPTVRSEFDLDLNKNIRYQMAVDPRIVSEFSTAAFRIGHTLIPRSFPLSSTRRVNLREIFFKPFEARENLDSLAEGILTAIDPEDRMQPSDNFVVDEVTAHLFENQEGARKGFDLVSLNLQRGRDHGIPPYNDVREALGLSRVTSFSDSALGANGALLQSVYDHVDDMELFAAGLSEPLHDGGLAGETFSRLIATQFQRLRAGDRFFYLNNRIFKK